MHCRGASRSPRSQRRAAAEEAAAAHERAQWHQQGGDQQQQQQCRVTVTLRRFVQVLGKGQEKHHKAAIALRRNQVKSSATNVV
jgi:hypothetical protein